MLSVATILKPQGLKGELKCKLLTDVLAVFNNEKIYIEGKEYLIEKHAVRQGFLYISLSSIKDRIEAEKFRNKDLCLPKDIIEKYADGKLLIDDLIGLNLYDEEGVFAGTILDYDSYSTTGFVTILVDNHEYDMPFINEIFIIEGKSVKVRRDVFERYKV